MSASFKIRQLRIAYLFLLPAIIVFLLGLVVPLANTLELSFNRLSMGSRWSDRDYVGVENYERMVDDDHVRSSIGVTLRFAAVVLVAELVIGMALALLLEKPIKGAIVFRTIFILPLMVSPVAVGLIWRYLLDGRIGLVNHYLGQLGIPPQTWLGNPDLAFLSIVITDIWQWTPFIFIILLAGLQALSAEVMEASRIDGANWWQMTFLIKIPMLRSILLVTVLLRLIDVFRALEVIFIMTFGGPGRSTQVMSLHIYKTAFTSQTLGYASTIAVVLMFLMLVLSLVLLLFSNPLKDRSDY